MLFLELYPNMSHLAYSREIIFSSLISMPFESCWLADHFIFCLLKFLHKLVSNTLNKASSRWLQLTFFLFIRIFTENLLNNMLANTQI